MNRKDILLTVPPMASINTSANGKKWNTHNENFVTFNESTV